jgi:hypothetical protein
MFGQPAHLDESLRNGHQATQPTGTASHATQATQAARHAAQAAQTTQTTTTMMFIIISMTPVITPATSPPMSNIFPLQERRQLDPKLPRDSSQHAA